MSLPAVVLAAGASRRLGYPKQLVEVEDQPLVRRAAQAALEAGFAPVRVVLGCRADEVALALAGLPVACLRNPAWEEGMASSLRAGLQGLPEASGVLLLVCDQVALAPSVLVQLREAFEAAPDRPAACAYGGVVGIPALFPSAWWPRLEALRGDQGARALLREAQVTPVPWPDGERDLDSPLDGGRGHHAPGTMPP